MQTQFGDTLNRCSRRFQVVSWPNLTLSHTQTGYTLKPCTRRFQVVSWPNLTVLHTQTGYMLKPWHLCSQVNAGSATILHGPSRWTYGVNTVQHGSPRSGSPSRSSKVHNGGFWHVKNHRKDPRFIQVHQASSRSITVAYGSTPGTPRFSPVHGPGCTGSPVLPLLSERSIMVIYLGLSVSMSVRMLNSKNNFYSDWLDFFTQEVSVLL